MRKGPSHATYTRALEILTDKVVGGVSGLVIGGGHLACLVQFGV